MSTLYSDFIYSNFPDQAYDTYEYMQDLTSDLVDLATQYETLINNKNFDEAASLLENNPSLNRIYFNAEKYNKLIDSIRATQRLYSEDVQTYILELVKYMGAYSSSMKYTKYNVVSYTDSMIYMCTSTSTPLGTLPTDTTYWYPLSIKGDQGESGLGLSFEKTWSDSIIYSKDSCVSYNNCLYASISDDNLAHTPSKNSEYWSLVVDFNTVTAYDNSSSNLSSTTMQNAIDELLTKIITNAKNINTNKNNISINTNDIATINNNISDINSRISNVNNTPDSEKFVNYSTSSGTANYANSAGTATSANYALNSSNADTIDGYHITTSTTEITAGSSLTNNIIYIVYE